MLGVLGLLLSVGGGGACAVSTFVCSSDDDCGPGGACEPQNVCSFPDPACPSGRRYGRYSGSYAEECTTVDEVDTDAEPPMAAEGVVSPDQSPSTGDQAGPAAGTSTTSAVSMTSAGSTTVMVGDEGSSVSSDSSDSSETGDVDEGDGEGTDTTTTTTTTTGLPSVSCDDRYGTAAGYLLCEQADGACRFYAETNGSCDALCSGLGGVCLTAFREVGNTCVIIEEIDCSETHADQICVCTL